ncbi:hypothetical protein ACFWA4_32410 [Streptomyces sp. NPDC060011]|uniref:hypothetical protein n=1 Tax=Streptomyces sp. NPDC060011 TaxID=3347037 RepID=UPI0036848BD9
MAEGNGRRAVPENVPDSPAPPESTPVTSGDNGTVRLTTAHVLPLIFFPIIGTVLFVVGMPVSDIPTFLGWCAGIGATATIAVTGGRRALLALAHGVIATTGTGK